MHPHSSYRCQGHPPPQPLKQLQTAETGDEMSEMSCLRAAPRNIQEISKIKFCEFAHRLG